MLGVGTQIINNSSLADKMLKTHGGLESQLGQGQICSLEKNLRAMMYDA